MALTYTTASTSPKRDLQQDEALPAAYGLHNTLPEINPSSSSDISIDSLVHVTASSSPLGSMGSFDMAPVTPSRNRTPWKLEPQGAPPSNEVAAQAFAGVSYSRVFVKNSCLTGGSASVSLSYVPPLTNGYHQIGYFQVQAGTTIYIAPTSNRFLYYNAYRNNKPNVGWGGSWSQYVPGRTGCAIRGMTEVDLGVLYADYVIDLIC